MKHLLAFLFLLPFLGFAQQKKSFELGDTLPEFTYTGQFARTHQLSELKGSYVLIHYWASWNEESRNMQIDFVSTYGKYKDKKFKLGRKFYIVSISLDESQKLWELALKKDNIPWKTHWCDMKGWNSPVLTGSLVQSIPNNFLLNPNGVIVAKNIKSEDLDKLLYGY